MTHRHYCACGNYLVCHQEPDQCPIRSYDCPVCEDKALDDYFASQLDTSTQQEQEQEHAHEGQ